MRLLLHFGGRWLHLLANMSLSVFNKIIRDGFCLKRNEDINDGDCYHWALLVSYIFEEVEFYSVDGHAWIKLGELYYDSESVCGVKDYDNLKCFTRWPWLKKDVVFKHISRSEFKKFWGIRF